MGSIVWIASYPESGAHWLSMFLANLISGSSEPCSLETRDLILPAENSATLYQPFFRKPLSELSMREVAQMRPRVHRELAARANQFLLLRTNCAAVEHLGSLTITPEVTSAAIYIVRNPLDVAASYGSTKGRAIDRTVAHMAQTGRIRGRTSKRTYEIVGSWSDNVASWTSRIRGRFLCLRFEDLLEDPVQHFTQVVDFLGMNATPEQVGRACRYSINGILADYKKAGIKMPRHLTPLQLLQSGAILRGKRLLTTQQIAEIAGKHREQMKKFGYWT